MVDIKIIKEMAAKLAHEIKYQQFNPNNVNHIVVRDRILEEYELLDETANKTTINEATIQDYGIGHKLIITSGRTKTFEKFALDNKIEIEEPITIVDYESNAPVFVIGKGDKRTTFIDSKNKKFTIQNPGKPIDWINHYTETDSSGKKPPGAEDYELGICVAYNMKMGMNRKEAIKKANIDENKFNEFDDSLLETGKAIVDSLKTNAGSYMVHQGSKQPSHSSNWVSGKSPSKTDMAGTSLNISLKMGDKNMVANPNGAEAVATFEAGLVLYNTYEQGDLANEVSKLTHVIENEWISVSKNLKITPMKKLGLEEYVKYRKEDLKEKYDNGHTDEHYETQATYEYQAGTKGNITKKVTDKIHEMGVIETDLETPINNWINDIKKNGFAGKDEMKNEISDLFLQSVNNKKFDKKLKEFFLNNPEYKKWIVFEAMTGQVKFAGTYSNDVSNISNVGVANYLLKANKSGGIIKSSAITPEFAATYSKNISSRVSFKHNKAAVFLEYLVDNFGVEDIKNRNIFDEVFEEEYNKMETRLNEAVDSHLELINEGLRDAMKNVKKATSDLANKAKKAFKSLFERFAKIYKEFIDGFFNKVINKIKVLAQKGMDMLMETLGYEFNTSDAAIKLEI